MMRLRYDEDLVESAVFFCSRNRRSAVPFLQLRRFHREREKLYSILDADERNVAFFRLHLEWFREWGWEKTLLDLLKEFPSLAAGLRVLAFRKARGKSEEGAELYVSEETGRNGVVALRAERFDDREELAGFLRHELMHIQDMIDPAFGYSPMLELPGASAARQRSTRERYRLLWDITIDGRLIQSGRGSIRTREKHRAAFERAYCFWPVDKRENAFEILWNGRSPRHDDLLAMASDPRESSLSHGPLPGACCPLCGFPTFRWADSLRMSASTQAAIHKEFPGWMPDQGVCNRCVEVFKAADALQQPAIS